MKHKLLRFFFKYRKISKAKILILIFQIKDAFVRTDESIDEKKLFQ